jgi:glycosyltransferase involved in cell wall biosynthesis
MIERAGQRGRVRLWGFRRDVENFYAAADVYALLSWGWEGLPISVIEAQACALPVVVTDAGGSAEGIAPGETGLLVPRRDETATAAALRTLIDDPGHARRMGAAGRRRCAEEFALDHMITRFEELYADARTD